ncbi:MAG: HAMP domain-containing sensor histidine kinase [bacterium]
MEVQLKTSRCQLDNSEVNFDEELHVPLLDATLQAVVEGIVVLGLDKKIICRNRQFDEMWQINESNFYYSNFDSIIDSIRNAIQDAKEFLPVTMELFFKPEKSYNQILLLKNEKAYEWFSRPLIIKGITAGMVWSFRDVTNLKIQEDEIRNHIEELHTTQDLIEQNAFELVQLNLKLEESETKLQETVASKDKFFSILAHDLKSPFTGLIGFTTMLVEDFDDFSRDELKEFLNNVNKSAKQTFALLENLLEWSRIQTGRMNFQPQNFDLAEVSETVTDLFSGNAAKKKITVNNLIEKSSVVNADTNMVNTLLRNLLSNAIKFTKPGGEIELNSESAEEYIKVSVKDSGVGMSPEDIDKLFRIDVHHTKRGTDNEKGTGLGLVLCEELVKKNGGKIWVESELNIGTTFSFTLPKG